MEGINFQRIEKEFDSRFEIAKRYYTIIFGLNNIHITKSELNLIAFSAINDTLTVSNIKQLFCKEFEVPPGSIYNMIWKLSKLDLLTKDKSNKIVINPNIKPDFNSNNILLAIKMIRKENE